MRLSKARKEFVNVMMKDTIFEAATSVLEKHGTGGVTMDRVAHQVGMATGSLYNYFHDKDELLQFCYSRLVEPFFHAIETIAREELPAPQKLEKILRTAWEHAIRQKGLLRVLADVNQGYQLRKKVRPRFLKLFVALFEQGIGEGTFRPHHAALTGRMFMGCLGELFELQAEGASSKEVAEYVGVLIESVTHGFSIHV